MDYLVSISQGRLDNIKPEQLKDIIAGYGQGIVRGHLVKQVLGVHYLIKTQEARH